nr:dihydrolipoamide acetyltransferase family protein [Rhodococcus sp. (in: high G+C Gram-positive bacteria)]
MSQSHQFTLPDVGEGLTEAEISSWHVAVGDTVAINDVLVEIETAKSAVELPSPYAGVVEQILVEEGSEVPVGTPIIVIGAGLADPQPAVVQPTVDRPAADQQGGDDGSSDDEKPQVLVGPGPKEAAVRRRRLAPQTADVVPVAAPPGARSDRNVARTTPVVRLFAQQQRVDLEELAHTTEGIITRNDVQRVAGVNERATPGSSSSSPDTRESRTPIKGVRKLVADAMTRSAFTAPHVTEWLTVDVTPTMELLASVKADRSWDGVRVNPLVFVAKAFLLAIRAYPDINATWDEVNNDIVVKHYVNLGIAAATPRGLIVPNIKNAHTLDTRQLAQALSDLVSVARSGKTPPSDMAHGTVTITNIGALGVDAGTPILNPGESAILAFGAIRDQPWVVDGRIEIRKVTQLAMSFDHRLVDGELGSHVLARTGSILANPRTALLFS